MPARRWGAKQRSRIKQNRHDPRKGVIRLLNLSLISRSPACQADHLISVSGLQLLLSCLHYRWLEVELTRIDNETLRV